ncbi:MAG TPA: MarR family transcriptional regulator [Allosphingosinicella sp.]|nr:MarR family transcriptional regulator [Allosphingosinicella sp.]
MNAPNRPRRARRESPEQFRPEPLFDARLLEPVDVARILVDHIKRRQDFLPGAVFEDPQWMMTLELFIAAEERREIPVTSLCCASGVPPTTALRHIRKLEAKGIFERLSHPSDKRITFVRLSKAARREVERYLHSINTCGRVTDDPPLRAAH